MTFQRQCRIPDTAPQQGRVGHDALHKAVVTAPQHLAGVRLLHAAGGVLLGVQQYAAVIAVDDQQRFTGKHAHHHVMDLRHRRRVRHRYIGRQKCRQIRDAFQAAHRQQPPDHPLDQGILRIAVHHPQPRPPSAYADLAAHHIEIAPYAQQIVQLCRPGVIVHHIHPPPVFPIMGISGGDYAKRCVPRRGTHLFYRRKILGLAGAEKRSRLRASAAHRLSGQSLL